MTAAYMQNLKRSIRYFFATAFPTWTWHLDTINETISAASFGILKSSTRMLEDATAPYVRDMVNLNLFDQDLSTHEAKVAQVLAGLKNRIIPLRDFIGERPTTITGYIRVTEVQVSFLGNTNGYFQTNFGIFLQIIE